METKKIALALALVPKKNIFYLLFYFFD